MTKRELQKGDNSIFSYQEFFDIILGYDDGKDNFTDIDFCVFYKKKDQSTGGVFSREYGRGLRSEGDLYSFPYICLMGELRPKPSYQNEEIIRFANIHDMEEVYLVAIDYNAAVGNRKVSFPTSIIIETLCTKPVVSFEFSKCENDRGCVYLMAVLREYTEESISITNKAALLELSEAVNIIPGFNTIIQ